MISEIQTKNSEEVQRELTKLKTLKPLKIINFLKFFEDLELIIDIFEKGSKVQTLRLKNQDQQNLGVISINFFHKKGLIEVVQAPFSQYKTLKTLSKIFPKDLKITLKKEFDDLTELTGNSILSTKEDLLKAVTTDQNPKSYINLGSQTNPKNLLRNLDKIMAEKKTMTSGFSLSESVKEIILKHLKNTGLSCL